jgi:hypothetical protein
VPVGAVGDFCHLASAVEESANTVATAENALFMASHLSADVGVSRFALFASILERASTLEYR